MFMQASMQVFASIDVVYELVEPIKHPNDPNIEA